MRWERIEVSWRNPTFRELYESLGGHAGREQAAAEATALAALLRLEPGMAVLDAACGYGRHAAALLPLDVGVVGLDFAEEYLWAARDEQGARLALVLADPCALPFAGGAFDAVYDLRLGADLRSDELLPQMLAEFARVLSPGGRLVIQTVSQPGRDETRVWRREGERFIMSEKTFDAGRSVYREVEYHLDLENGAAREWAQETRRHSVDEWRRMLGRAGFRTTGSYGGLDRRAARNSPDLVLTAVRL